MAFRIYTKRKYNRKSSKFNLIIKNDIDIIKDSLIEQISGRVEWLDTILHMKEMGINQLYEVGPGDVLKKLNQTITFKPKCSSLEL